MKTAISIPDPLFEQADALANRLQKSRSQLYADALRDFVARHDHDSVTERLDAIHGELRPSEDLEGFSRAASREILQRNEW